ncbi:hypothetical protein HPB48_011732 [Haemaphysalis longicornis]|uniref:Uncharacterized protein n=1 Tax=Haemaphysalis longicornis TaxID=44386 RepID=A0A9J6FAX0_HAELO|nr:hypothetical protein HPB48_011732 [Haemaphysalis longicornis]
MLEQILKNQKEASDATKTIKADIAALNAKTDKLTHSLALIQEMNVRIEYLESVVQRQAEQLVELKTEVEEITS